MAWTKADLDEVEAAIQRGELTVQLGERRITYQNAKEMLQVRNTMKASIDAQNAAAAAATEGWPNRRSLLRYRSGY